MDWDFLVPLLIAGGVVIVLKNSADEIAYLSVAILGVCLIVSLVTAPWQIQGLLLLLVLWRTQRLIPDNQTVNEDSPLLKNEKLPQQKIEAEHLSYRGVDYDVKLPVIEESKREIAGKYRGQIWNSHEVKVNETPEAPAEIKYRGAKIRN